MNVNPATLVMQKMAKMLISTDEVLAKMGEMPYGMRKATRADQRRMVEGLDVNGVIRLVEQHGYKDVADLFRKAQPKEKTDGRQMV